MTNNKILVTGGNGFLGKFVVQKLYERGIKKENIIIPNSQSQDLRVWSNCLEVTESIEVVIHLAAKSGGIGFSQKRPGELFYDNLIMGAHIFEASRLNKIKKLVSLGTISSYPRFASVPFQEKELWNGYPEESNAPYGLAKKMMLVQAQAYRKQYNFNAVYLMTGNLYGPTATLDPERSHVIPSLIKKINDAKSHNKKYIEVWGSADTTRDFLYVEDAAEGIVLATEKYNETDPVNIGSGSEISIGSVVEIIASEMNYNGEIKWQDTTKEGSSRKSLSTKEAEIKFGFKAKTSFEEGLIKTANWYKNKLQSI